MKSISLQEHIAQSKIAVAANRAKGNRHGQILSMLYSDPAHFAEELIQNAEDAIARRQQAEEPGCVKIVFDPEGVSFFHNGDPFNESDLMAITTYASTTKKGLPGINQIGKFGIGFRSVYGITDSPEIHSGKHHYRIADYEVLEEIAEENTSEFTTYIRLPFKPSVGADFRKSLADSVQNLNAEFLLFLNQITQIEIISQDTATVFSCGTETFGKNLTIKNILVSRNGRRNNKQFLLFKRSAGHNKEAAVAFGLNDTRSFIPENNPYASVYFSTKMRIAHSVLVHGSFTTTPNRENIPFSDEWTPENKTVLSVLSDLMRIALRSLLSNNMISADFWKLFAWSNSAPDPISATISESLDAFIAREKCILDSENNKRLASDLCIAEEESLLRLLNNKEVGAVYSRFGFLLLDISENETFVSHLRKNHKLKLADIDSFAFFTGQHPEFLHKKSLKWFPEFFGFLSEHPRLWDQAHKGRYYNLRDKAIIPDKGRKMIVPFSIDDKPQVFIGKAANGFSAVHPELAQDATCMNFFSMLGIPDFAPGLSQAESLVRRFNEKTANAWWLRLYELYSKSDENVKDSIRKKAAELNCLPCVESLNGNKVFVKPQQAYIPDHHLTAFLSFRSSFFVHKQLASFFSGHGVSVSALNHFLSEFGVSTGLKVFETKGDFSDDHKSALRAGYDIYPVVRENISDYSLEGLDTFLNRPVPTAAAALWNLLGRLDEKFHKAAYTFESYVRSETVFFQPEYIRRLKNSEWMFDAQLNPVMPSGFPAEKLHEYFRQSDPVSLWMASELGLIAGTVTDEEKELLSLIRKNKLDSITLKKLIQDQNTEITVLKYSPLSANSDKAVLAGDPMLQMLSGTMPLHIQNTESWDQWLFDEKSGHLKNHLLTKVLASSKTLQAYISAPGHIEISDTDFVLTHYFIGIRPDAGEPVLLPSSFAKWLQERPGRKDTGLFVYNLKDNNCVEISPENISDFLLHHPVALVQPMKLTND